MQFAAVLLEEEGGKTTLLTLDQLPDAELLVRVRYSSLNYKDALALTGHPGVVRHYPMVPGIDLAGEVEESRSDAFQPGDRVVVTGCGLGERHFGGLSCYARVQADWCVPLPAAFTLEQAMAIGTAGFTAMQCIQALEHHGLQPGAGPVLVTGAAGGVGSLAVLLLSALGHQVVAATRRTEEKDYLHALGAAEVISSETLHANPDALLTKSRWAGAVDPTGGEILAGLLRGLLPGASVACCGLAADPNLATSLYPFILRGNNLLGINSVEVPNPQRRALWQRLAHLVPKDKLAQIYTRMPLDRAVMMAFPLRNGEVRGRIVVQLP